MSWTYMNASFAPMETICLVRTICYFKNVRYLPASSILYISSMLHISTPNMIIVLLQAAAAPSA